MKPETLNGVTISGDKAVLEVEHLQWRPSAYALIFDDKNRVLLVDNAWNGKREFPGGGVDVWENIVDGLKREIWEETGLEAKLGDMIHIDESFFLTPGGNHWHSIKFYYFAEITGGTLRATICDDEPTGFPYWFNLHDLGAKDLTIGWDALQKALAIKSSR